MTLPLLKIIEFEKSFISLFIPLIVGLLLICLLVRTPINKDERLILTKYFCSSSIFYASDVGRWCFLVVKVSGMLYLWAIIATHQDPYWAQPRIQTIQNCTLNVRLFLTFAWPQYSIITKKTFLRLVFMGRGYKINQWEAREHSSIVINTIIERGGIAPRKS